MKLLATVLPRVRRLVPSAERGLSVALVGFLVALEFAGYYAATELHDALAGTALIAVGLFVVAYHRARPLDWLEALQIRGQAWLERLGQLKYDVGIDFRGDPPLPRKLPRIVPLAFIGSAVAAGLAFVAWAWFPDGWRGLGLKTSYVLYLIVLMLLWSLLTAFIAGGILLPVMLLDQRVRASGSEALPGPPDAVVVCGYGLLTALIACVAPPIYATGLCGVAVLVGLAACLIDRRDDPAMLWRQSAGQTVYAVPLRRLLGVAIALLGMFAFTLIAWACGSRMLDAPSFEVGMPFTLFLGSLAAWVLPGVAIVLAWQWLDFQRTNPVRSSPPTVHLEGGTAATWRAIRRWGFRVTRGARSREHVGLRIVAPAQSEAMEFNPDWPLRVSPADLDGTLVRDRVARRDELQLRRQFFRSLAVVIKGARAAAPTRGGGFLVAPHYWFIPAVLWADPEHGPDAEEDILRPLGPTFRRVIPVRARQYIHRVLRATQIDAIFLEDGIGHRKLEKVLRAVLELYDIHGGRRRAEDHHFQGLPKIKVVIHEYAPGNPFHRENYPEPKFDEVSRSRVLHIFKDRGESEEWADPPFDFSWEPMPLYFS